MAVSLFIVLSAVRHLECVDVLLASATRLSSLVKYPSFYFSLVLGAASTEEHREERGKRGEEEGVGARFALLAKRNAGPWLTADWGAGQGGAGRGGAEGRALAGRRWIAVAPPPPPRPLSPCSDFHLPPSRSLPLRDGMAWERRDPRCVPGPAGVGITPQ